MVRELTNGRGADSVIDAVGMEAHGSPVAQGIQKFVGLLPDAIAEPMMKEAGIDRLAALHTALDAVRRGGTVSPPGVYGGEVDRKSVVEGKSVAVRVDLEGSRLITKK